MEEYNLVSYKVLGKVFYQKNRKITKELSSNVRYDYLESEPISSLFLAVYPYLLVDGYELYQEQKWKDFAVDFIAYSLIESFLRKKIILQEFHDTTEVSFNIYKETDVNLVIAAGSVAFDDFDKMEETIKALCEFEKYNNKSGSNLNNQLRNLVKSFTSVNDNPFKQFSKVCLSKAKKMDGFYHLNQFSTKEMFFEKVDTRLEFEKSKLDQLRRMLDRRKARIDFEVGKDQFFLKRFMDRVKQILLKEIASFESDDGGTGTD